MFTLAEITLVNIAEWILLVSIPILALYLIYLVLTKAFNYMGFSSLEAILIVFFSFLFEFNIIIFGFNISNIHIFSYNNWNIGINMGGAIIPIILSIYLTVKKNIDIKKIIIGIVIVTVVAFLVSTPVKTSGIVSAFPYWLLPAIFASICSVILYWKDFIKAAPLAYISGTIGVLVGADFLHLSELLSFQTDKTVNAVIGGANVFDMIFITGILAVVLDSIIMFRQRSRRSD
jgi:uncharacterized membrane protein